MIRDRKPCPHGKLDVGGERRRFHLLHDVGHADEVTMFDTFTEGAEPARLGQSNDDQTAARCLDGHPAVPPRLRQQRTLQAIASSKQRSWLSHRHSDA
jgi:hypothetical protein